MKKENTDLEFISLLSKAAGRADVRAIVHGGYSVDGAVGKITRPHNNIDIQLYGTNEDGLQIIKQLFQSIPQDKFDSSLLTITDKGVSTYYHNYLVQKDRFGADIYYIRVKNNPFDKTKKILKNDGTESEPQVFETHKVTLNGVSYEATLPENELNDKITKKERGEKPRKEIDQDIDKLKRLLGQK